MSIYERMKAETLGKSFDIDGFPSEQPYQCWDYVMYCAERYLGGTRINCGETGYVCDIANQSSYNGILNWCKDIGLYTELEPGDILVWGFGSNEAPFSHIAFYDHDNGQNDIHFLGQNQPNSCVNITRIGVSGVIGVYRPYAIINESKNTEQQIVENIVQSSNETNSTENKKTYKVTVEEM